MPGARRGLQSPGPQGWKSRTSGDRAGVSGAGERIGDVSQPLMAIDLLGSGRPYQGWYRLLLFWLDWKVDQLCCSPGTAIVGSQGMGWPLGLGASQQCPRPL